MWPTACSRRSRRAARQGSIDSGAPISRCGASARGDNDKARALRVIDWFSDWFITATTRRRYEILDRRVFEGGFVQQHVLYATGHAGQSISMRVCIVIRLDITGLIDRIDEHFDPPEIAPLID
jgi:hypothetical protein